MIEMIETIENIENIENIEKDFEGNFFAEVSQPNICGETKLPCRATNRSAGYDFFSKEEVTLEPGETHLFTTDVKCHLKDNCYLQISTRSSVAIKRGLVLKNQVAIIDADYYGNEENEGNIRIAIKNDSYFLQDIKIGDRIAQGVIIHYQTTSNDDIDYARKGGIGSTGV